MVCLEHGLPLVAIMDLDIVIPPSDIQLREKHRPVAMHFYKSIHKLPDEWEWGGIPDGEGVQLTVVLNRSEITILLLDKEEGEHVGGFGLTDVPFSQIFGDEFLKGNVFCWG
jgi:hypothetical protein